uniref:Uncharacterized protein n=1 Tax=viral metagenome TaxID=1070528 RepID=A0A6C0BCC6_9ZZZZ
MKRLFIISVLFLLLAFACFFGPLKFVEGHGGMGHMGIGRGGGFGMGGRSFGRGYTYGDPRSYYNGWSGNNGWGGDYYNEIPVYYPEYYHSANYLY